MQRFGGFVAKYMGDGPPKVGYSPTGKLADVTPASTYGAAGGLIVLLQPGLRLQRRSDSDADTKQSRRERKDQKR